MRFTFQKLETLQEWGDMEDGIWDIAMNIVAIRKGITVADMWYQRDEDTQELKDEYSKFFREISLELENSIRLLINKKLHSQRVN
jgi:hypothetical protein